MTNSLIKISYVDLREMVYAKNKLIEMKVAVCMLLLFNGMTL